eukprot:CAMPEP_0170743114 /NCGR_PEP_ID=MMETSP0437-20130122/7098_1 /TAXON_ID=0 /ORGANISM="Sexangularia sp." /LENGTH=353 /DNA_ID=CAMNT_0011081767 /DNA_START=38 /DNA_END=1099 /DNA_ORIENTATION=-
MTSALKQKKLAEALASVAEAKKAESTGMFKWKADLDTASLCYASAGTSFKLAGDHSQAASAFANAARTFYANGFPYSAGKNLEAQADEVVAGADGGDAAARGVAASLSEAAATYYQEDGKPHVAAAAYARGAAFLAPVNSADSVTMYQQAITLLEEEDGPHKAGPFITKAISVAMRAKRFDAAVDLCMQHARIAETLKHNHQAHQALLAAIIVTLAQGDFTAASRRFDDIVIADVTGFSASDEGRAAMQLLTAYEEDDVDALAAVRSQQLFSFLHNEVARLAKTLRIPGGGGGGGGANAGGKGKGRAGGGSAADAARASLLGGEGSASAGAGADTTSGGNDVGGDEDESDDLT